jgi:hypothetical protein
VLQLQESCRDAKNEALSLDQENARLRHEFKEREKYWRALWSAKKAGQDVEPDELTPNVASALSYSPPTSASPQHPSYPSSSTGYIQNEPPVITSNDSFSADTHFNSANPFTDDTNPLLNLEPSSQIVGHHGQQLNSYRYPIQRNNNWNSIDAQSASPVSDSAGIPHITEQRSSGYVSSSAVHPNHELAYPTAKFHDEGKVALSALDAAPYMFPSSRSLSPTVTTSTTSAAMPPYPFPVSSSMQEHADFDYRPQQPTEINLHGGTADMTSIASSSSKSIRYNVVGRLPATGLHSLSTMPRSDLGLQREDGGPDHQVSLGIGSRSRSSSPGVPALSGTLAVIKNQAFGTLRKARPRMSRSSTNLVLNMLDSSGFGVGVDDPSAAHDTDEEESPR